MTERDGGAALNDLHEFSVEERYAYLLRDPLGASHLFSLLAKGKGDTDSFNTMLCRVMRSAQKAARGGQQ